MRQNADGKRPRYLVLTELFLPTKGGTAVWFDEVYRRVGGKGIHIVTADVPGASAHDRQNPNSVHRIALRRVRWMRPESLWMYVKLLTKACRLALQYRFDAVHAGRVLPEGLVAWLVARIYGLPCTIYAHGEEITTWRQPVKFRAMRWVYRLADRVIANSEFTRTELLKLCVPAERITVIHPGVDLQRFRPGLLTADLRSRLGLADDHKLIVSVGRLSRRKGFDQVIRSIPSLVARGLDVHCVIIGLGEDRAYLTELAQELGVGPRVHLLGHVDPDELPRWLNAADVFAMPNRAIDGDTEGFGMVFLEAAACGKPVVAGLDGGTAAAVVHNETGLRVGSQDLSQVTNALERLLRDNALARTLGHAALSRVRGSFGWDRVAEATMQLQSTTTIERHRGACTGKSS